MYFEINWKRLNTKYKATNLSVDSTHVVILILIPISLKIIFHPHRKPKKIPPSNICRYFSLFFLFLCYSHVTHLIDPFTTNCSTTNAIQHKSICIYHRILAVLFVVGDKYNFSSLCGIPTRAANTLCDHNDTSKFHRYYGQPRCGTCTFKENRQPIEGQHV